MTRSTPTSRTAPLLLPAEVLEQTRSRLRAGEAALQPAWMALCERAERAAGEPAESVVDKKAMPASGDRHDFASLAVYWWPNPDSEDGRPYHRRDGHINPEVNDYDWPAWDRTEKRVRDLGLSVYFGEDPAHAERAAQLLRTWFLDPATAMNPNMNHAACIPGRNPGRCFGIIHVGSTLPMIIDVSGLLGGAWSASDAAAFSTWLGQFHDWLTQSKLGRSEDEQANNHAVMYDRLVAMLALHVGRDAAARQVLEAVPARRLPQIEADGRMPRELGRTRSWHYSVMNLTAFFGLARLAAHVGIDLWHTKGNDGGGLRDAAMFLFEHARSEEAWPHDQIGDVDYGLLTPLVVEARAVYGAPFAPESFAHRLKRPEEEAKRLHHLTRCHEAYF